MMWLWLPVAWADPPTDLVHLWPIGEGNGAEVERMAVSLGGDLVVGRTRGDLKGWVLDVDAWDLKVINSACQVTGIAPVPYDGGWEIWMSCGDGSVQASSYDRGVLAPLQDEEGNNIAFDGVDTTLSGLWYDEASELLYALHVPEEGTGNPRVHVIDPNALTLDATVLPSYPVTLPWPGFNEGVISDGRLAISHANGRMSTLPLGSAGGAPLPDQAGTAIQCDDIAPGPPGSQLVYCVGSAGGAGTAYAYVYGSNMYNALGLGQLNEPKAICASEDVTDRWLVVTGQQVQVWTLDPNPELYFSGPPDANSPIQDMVASEGYLFGGGLESTLHVVTSRPWLPPGQISVAPAGLLTRGDKFVLTFTVDEDADYKVFANGDRTGSGEQLASGEAAEGEPVTAELEINGDYAEGENRIYVIATSKETGLEGHGRATVQVDNPPLPPELDGRSVQFADGGLVLSFQGIPDADLLQYEIYVSDAPFNKEDFPTGGPAFEGDIKTPIVLNDVEPGGRVTHRIAPLTNGVTYYIGVRARDEGDKEGPMSNVVKGTPQRTYTAAELAGEPGGTPCSTGPAAAASMGWLGLVLGGLLLRSRRLGLAAGAALALCSLLPGTAQAKDDDPWWRQDMTPARANFNIRYGSIALRDEYIDRVYRNGAHNLLQAEIGPQLFRYAEIDFGFGFFQEIAKTITSDGVPSADTTMLTWFPLSLDVTGRAHLLDEQPAVPYFRYGWDYVIWSEKADDGFGGKEVLRGGKFGTHTGLGVELLLDLLAPGRASFLEAQTGINDSWITIEWRHQTIDARKRPWSGRTNPDDRLDFSGDAIMVGLKLDW